jgi:hypothetical protein
MHLLIALFADGVKEIAQIRKACETVDAESRLQFKQRLLALALREIKGKAWIGVMACTDAMMELDLVPSASSLSLLITVRTCQAT